jgi:hypothetical protein
MTPCVVVAVGESAICRAANMVGPEDPGDFARQGRLRRTQVFEQTDGVMNVEAVLSGQGAREDSGYGLSRRLTSKMKLLMTRLAA